jgi:hypothetical protein
MKQNLRLRCWFEEETTSTPLRSPNIMATG